MRIIVNGKMIDTIFTPVLLVFDENEKDIFNGMNRFVSAPPNSDKGEMDKLMNTNINEVDNYPDIKQDLADLMDAYCKYYQKLEDERQEAKRDEDVEAELISEGQKRVASKMIAELYKVQKRLGFIKEENINGDQI